ncbi:unnamed protein product (macronuclear) [Paramecium tetraurelia]|uniref:Ion transport domain-containing protein n=1 Tax=Paramecium tetraurelia TaxID=5888 RepID=A0DRJ4_PARTE|nr:uncharacterized protein GSPATT00019379001 [Paramecium tetraurelia]CAK85661.1 unnamed protein product [Paramecium tetraurelia]|eukprot:XP_001453058.1 hypothetical protein (macronuclear) [Paramecium tetraurelia strain d4-2]
MKNGIILEQYEDEDEYEIQEEKQRQERKEYLRRMQQMIFDETHYDIALQQNTESQIIQEYLIDLDNEFYIDYTHQLPAPSSQIKLRPMNELQLAYIYVDDFPFLKMRRLLMIIFQSVRYLMKYLINLKFFQLILMVIIILNSLCLALEVDQYEIIFIICYSVEAIFKMLALGLYSKRDSYFRDFWNVIDFVILVFQYLPYFVNIQFNFNALRTIRILRSLDAGQSIPALKVILTSLFQSVYQLKDALIVLVFSYSIFAIVALLLFSGGLKRRCVNLETGIPRNNEVCSECQGEFECVKQIANPFNSLINFDTFGWSLIQVFICTLLESWSQILDYTVAAYNEAVYIYFFMVVMVGGFFLVNLTLAIIKLNFSNNQKFVIPPVIEESYDYWELRIMGIYEPAKLQIQAALRRKSDAQFTFRERSQRTQTRRKLRITKYPSQIQNLSLKIHPIKFANNFSTPFVKQDKKFMGIYGMGKKLQPIIGGVTPSKNARNKLNFNQEQPGQSILQSPIDQNISFSYNLSPNNKLGNMLFSQSNRTLLNNQTKQLSSKSILNNNKSPNNRSRIISPQNQRNHNELNNGSPKSQFSKQIVKRAVRPSISESDQILVNDLKMIGQPQSKKTITTPKNTEEQLLDFLSQAQNNNNILTNENQSNGLLTPNNQLNLQNPTFNRANLQHGTYAPKTSHQIQMLQDVKQRSFNVRNKQIDQVKNDVSILDKSENSIINSIPSEQVDQELMDLGILEINNIKKQKPEMQQNSSFKMNYIRRKKPRLTRKTLRKSTYLSKTFNSANDDRFQQLKIKLFKTKFYKEVPYLPYTSNSELDVLEVQQMKKIQQNLKNNEEINRKLKKQVKYVFSNQQTQLTNLKSTSKLQPSSTQIKSTNAKRSQKQVKFQDQEEQQQYKKLILHDVQLNFQEAQLLMRKEVQAVDLEQYGQVEIQYDLKEQLRYLNYEQITITTSTNYSEYVKFMSEASSKLEIVQQSSIEDVLPMSDYVDDQTISIMNQIMLALNYTINIYEIWLPGISGIFKVFRVKLQNLIQSEYFNRLINFCVACNTIVLALDGLVTNDKLLSDLNLAFTIIFIIELGFKLIGLGVKGYVQDKFNLFDALIVGISLYEVIINQENGGKSGFSALRSLRIFRALRVLRISKLIRSLKFMGFLLKVLGNAFEQILWMFILMLFFLYTFTILGFSLFQGEISDENYRYTFNSFIISFETVFQLFTISNWSDVLYSLFLSNANNIVVFLYLVLWIAIGNYIFLNLFLAVLLDNFEAEYRRDKNQIDNNIIIGRDQIFESAISSKPQGSRKSSKSSLQDDVEEYQKLQTQRFIYFSERGIAEFALMVLSQESAFRKMCYRAVKDKIFDIIILILILISSAKLILDTYTLGNSYDVVSYWLDFSMVILFGCEALLKIIAFGFIGDDLSYLRNSWNALDFIILIGSIVDISVAAIDLSYLKILRLFRTLRPLRFVSHNRSMKIIVSALLQSADGILNVAIVIILVWMMFAIIGINFAKGKLYYCDMGDGAMHYVTKAECEGVWRIYDSNFENIFSGMLTLFCLSTLLDWPDQLLYFKDGTENGLVKDSSPEFFLFFLAFILIGSILLNNLFIGVILVNFHIAEEKARDSSLTQDQIQWIDTQKLIIEAKPDLSLYYMPKNRIQAFLFRIVKARNFDLIISLFIIINIVVTGMYMDDGDLEYLYVIDQINFAISIIFCFEAIIKIITFGPLAYFKVNWNQFDFVIVVISIIDFATNESGLSIGKGFRILRAVRLLRLVKQFKGLKKLIDTAVFSIPAIINAAALYFLIHSIFSVLGVFLFSDIKEGKIISDTNNFQDFHHSFILLFLSQTGLDWNRIMYDTMNNGSQYNALFWVVFILIQNFVMLNLFILIVLDQYDVNYFHEDNPLNRFDEYQNKTLDVWTRFSQDGAIINQNKLTDLILALPKPLGLDIVKSTQKGVEDWKHINPQHTQDEVSQLKFTIQADLIRNALFKIMDMQLKCDSLGNIPYNLVLFAVMKEAYLEKLEINLTEEGGRKLVMKEMETRSEIEEEYGMSLDQDVNPLVSYLYAQTCFKAMQRFVEISKNKVQDDGVSFLAKTDSSIDFEEYLDNDLSRDDYEKPDYEEVYFVEIPMNNKIYNGEQYKVQIAQDQSSQDQESNEQPIDDENNVEELEEYKLQIVDFNKYLGDQD